MSHFTVLVAATDRKELEAKLLPYYEYGCSQEMDELVQPYLEFKIEHRAADFEKDARAIMMKDYVQNHPTLKKEYEAYFEDQQYTRIFKSWDHGEMHDGNWGHWHNPNAKWDWWTVGGRWAGAIFGDAVATPNFVAMGRSSDKDCVSVGQ